MAFILDDRVRESSTTTGTGDFTLAGAVSGFKSFASRMSVNDTTWYAIINGTEWETGLGTYSASNTLTRTTVYRSSNADSPVSFSAGTKDVFVDLPGVVVPVAAGKAQTLTSGQQAQAATNIGAVRVVKHQKFTASGTYTPSTGMLYCIIEVVGGGGGGAGVASSGTFVLGGGGGGAGGYSRKYATASDIGASQTVTIGAAGAAGGGAANGGAGGSSSVGSLCIGLGGAGGGVGATASAGSGGAGGAAGTGDITAAGAPGGSTVSVTAASANASSGFGGSSHFGGGATGKSSAGAGNAASNYGSGGGGAYDSATSSAFGGGAGTAGFIVITEFCTQ